MTTMAYPFEITPSGKVATAEGDEAMLQQVRMTLSTTLGTRAMRPTFGSSLGSQVFEPLDAAGISDMRESVINAVKSAVAGAQVPHVGIDVDEDLGILSVNVLVSREQEVDPRTFSVELSFGRVVEDTTP